MVQKTELPGNTVPMVTTPGMVPKTETPIPTFNMSLFQANETNTTSVKNEKTTDSPQKEEMVTVPPAGGINSVSDSEKKLILTNNKVQSNEDTEKPIIKKTLTLPPFPSINTIQGVNTDNETTIAQNNIPKTNNEVSNNMVNVKVPNKIDSGNNTVKKISEAELPKLNTKAKEISNLPPLMVGKTPDYLQNIVDKKSPEQTPEVKQEGTKNIARNTPPTVSKLKSRLTEEKPIVYNTEKKTSQHELPPVSKSEMITVNTKIEQSPETTNAKKDILMYAHKQLFAVVLVEASATNTTNTGNTDNTINTNNANNRAKTTDIAKVEEKQVVSPLSPISKTIPVPPVPNLKQEKTLNTVKQPKTDPETVVVKSESLPERKLFPENTWSFITIHDFTTLVRNQQNSVLPPAKHAVENTLGNTISVPENNPFTIPLQFDTKEESAPDSVLATSPVVNTGIPAFATTSMNTTSMNTTPMNTTPMNTTPMNTTPMNTTNLEQESFDDEEPFAFAQSNSSTFVSSQNNDIPSNSNDDSFAFAQSNGGQAETSSTPGFIFDETTNRLPSSATINEPTYSGRPVPEEQLEALRNSGIEVVPLTQEQYKNALSKASGIAAQGQEQMKNTTKNKDDKSKTSTNKNKAATSGESTEKKSGGFFSSFKKIPIPKVELGVN